MRKQNRAGKGKGQPDVWLTWPAGVAGKTGWAAECLLRQYGIAALNRRYAYSAEDSYGVLVAGSQAKWAEYLLMAGGYPLNSRLLNPKHANIKREAMPPTWGSPARPSGLLGWYHRLFGLATVGDTAVELKTRNTKHEGKDVMKRILWRTRRKLKWWLRENHPIQCASCGRICRRKNAHMEIHYVAGATWLCAACDRRLHMYDGGRK